MRHDPWLTEISPDDIEAAMQRKAAREALIVEQAAEIARLRAERDALRARADQAALGHAREADRADRSEFLHKQEIAELQGRAVKWAGFVGALMAERDLLIYVLQIAVERSGNLEPRPSWVDGACGLLNRGFLKVDRAALDQATALQGRVAELERLAGLADSWITAALECKDWHWDADQHEAATHTRDEIRAALR